eukprot:SAG11_NODE_14265_length_619_cov_0.988462_2_plen_66_part_01
MSVERRMLYPHLVLVTKRSIFEIGRPKPYACSVSSAISAKNVIPEPYEDPGSEPEQCTVEEERTDS